jgi:hypothetical protein
MKKSSLILIFLLTIIGLTSCATDQTITYAEDGDVVELRDTYENKFNEELIPGQWEGYGIGDPFVYRFNGKYYLYASTKNNEIGVRAWESSDLIHWEQITGDGLPTGYVSTDPVTLSAYAPEVIYVDGTFYMITSPGGSGHYLLSSDSPAGPFVAITGNLGQSIDGSFFMDDDEQLYFLRASTNGIRIVKVNDDMSFDTGYTLDNTIIGSWTEGPYLLKREGTYYLTFTGNHVTSPGYRIAYSYSTDTTFTRDAYSYGDNILLSTDDDFNGLGHSSTVMGPDMDSYYIAYHNLNNSGGPNRSFNLSRLLFNGTSMTVNNPELEGSFVPSSATFTAADDSELASNNEFLLSDIATDDVFTAEYNFIGEHVKSVFNYEDDENYHYVTISGQDISLFEVNDGQETMVNKVTLNKTYDFEVLHTLRVAYRDGKLDVYFDNMRKIADFDIDLNGGYIGYVDSSEIDIEYTAFSNVAKGLSDQEEVKQSVIQANQFNEDTANLSNDSGLVLEDNDISSETYNGLNESYDLLLGKKGDYVQYLTYVETAGYYGIEMRLPSKYTGTSIGLQIDEATPMRIEVPDVETSMDYVSVVLTQLELPQGAHYIKFVNLKDDFQFSSFELFESSKTDPSFENSLESYVLEGSNYVNSWKLDDGHYALEGNRQLLYFGDDKFTDFTISVDISFVGDTQTRTAGLILRADNPAFTTHDTNQSIQGYYIGMNNHKVFINRYNYNLSEYDLDAAADTYDSDVFYTLKVVMNGNRIKVYIDDELIFDYVDADAILYGQVGLYTEGAGSIYKNLSIEPS